MIATLNTARRELLDIVDGYAIEHFPKQSGQAYFFFDCWVERQEENWVNEHIEPCQDKFFETLYQLKILKENHKQKLIDEAKAFLAEAEKEEIAAGKLEESTTSLSEAIEEAAAEEEAAIEKKAPEEEKGYIIFFDFNKSGISDEGHQIIGKLVAYLKSNDKYSLTINGHTDRAGSESFNLNLSRNRANSVAAELIKNGISKDKIKTFGFGESDPIRQTEDGVRDPVNRRVEVIIVQ